MSFHDLAVLTRSGMSAQACAEHILANCSAESLISTMDRLAGMNTEQSERIYSAIEDILYPRG